MASYNEIDGVPSHANQWLLRDVLRKEWGFEGFLISDYNALDDIPGLGPARKKRLVKELGGVNAVKRATPAASVALR